MRQFDRERRRDASVAMLPRPDFRPSVQAVFKRLVVSGARYDAAPLYPQESVEALRGAGLHRLFAPPESGG